MAIDTMAKLREVYPPPAARAGLKILDHLDLHCRNFIALSPFYVISSARADGRPDASPRGDPPGSLAYAMDDKMLLLPDRPGNRQVDTLMNYSCRCNCFPSSDPSFTIRCPRALKTLCGRLEIVDRRDDHALISAAGHHRHDCRCHQTTIERRPATRTRGGRTEAQESRTAAQDVPVRPLACGPARRPALSRTLPWKQRESNPFDRVSVTD